MLESAGADRYITSYIRRNTVIDDNLVAVRIGRREDSIGESFASDDFLTLDRTQETAFATETHIGL